MRTSRPLSSVLFDAIAACLSAIGPNPSSLKTFLTIVLLFSSPGLFAQTTLADSLRKELSVAATDTSRIRLLKELATTIQQSNPDSALLLLRAGILLAEKLDYKPDLFDLYLTIGTSYGFRHQRDSALLVFDIARQLAEELKDQARLSEVLYEIGVAQKYPQQKKIGHR